MTGSIPFDKPQAKIVPRSSLAPTLAAIGVVFGDIGTSPLYALREALLASRDGGGPILVQDIYGILSLILWALILVVTVKYVLILLRADNHGEGGTLSLLALAGPQDRGAGKWILVLGLVGAAMFFGDAVITPAVSVLSAVEGVKLIYPELSSSVIPISLGVLGLLFLCQSKGTDKIARFFAPVMLVWFVVLALSGLWSMLDHPQVLQAINPVYAARYLAAHGGIGFIVLGAAFLAVTGAEALYADMGHFGRRPIMLAWLLIAGPALVLNYFGQAAVLIADPSAIEAPFFRLFSPELLPFVVVLAAMATVIASQAVISGAFSITRQAVQLRLLPRLRIRHTSADHEGQIYVPSVNILLAVGVIGLIISFGSSGALAGAYGVSVTGAMIVTTILAIIVAARRWYWAWWRIGLIFGPLLLVDMVFASANLLKLAEGGWLPLTLAAAIFAVMWSWHKGASYMQSYQQKTEIALDLMRPQLKSPSIRVIDGMGVYLTTSHRHAPAALLHCLKHFRTIHEHNLLLIVQTANQPYVEESARFTQIPLDPRLSLVTLTFGYSQTPDVAKALMAHYNDGKGFDIMTTSFVLSRRRLGLSRQSTLPLWQARIFLWCARNAAGPTDYFRLPATRVVEIGTQVNV